MIEELYRLSEKLYQAYEENDINEIVGIIEKATEKLSMVKLLEEDIDYFNIIVENILGAIEIKDWIFVSDVLRYELAGFVKEACGECL